MCIRDSPETGLPMEPMGGQSPDNTNGASGKTPLDPEAPTLT